MKNRNIIALIILFITSTLYSQSNMNLNGTNSINVSLGLKMNSTTSTSSSLSGVETETNFIIDFNYQYWFDNQWSINASIGAFGVGTNVNYTNISSVTIVPLLFGFSYYPQALLLGNVGRVHFGVNTGVYIGSGQTSNVSLFNTGSEAVIETVFGVEPNVGVDFFISNWLKIGPEISYHLLSEFTKLSDKSYNGGVFSINFGILL